MSHLHDLNIENILYLGHDDDIVTTDVAVKALGKPGKPISYKTLMRRLNGAPSKRLPSTKVFGRRHMLLGDLRKLMRPLAETPRTRRGT